MGTLITGIVGEIIAKVIIPELIDIIRKNPGKTDEEVIAEFAQRRARIIEKGKAFLDETEIEG